MSKARDIASAIPAPSTVSSAELGYLDGVTSAIQTQIDSKIGSASAINPTIVDAKGDIIAATAADTVARLAVGANGTVLTAASGQATGLEWATPSSGGMTLISTTTLAGTTTISSIPSGYVNLEVHIFRTKNSAGNYDLYCFPNGSSLATDEFSNRASTGTMSFRQDDYIRFTGTASSAMANDQTNAWVYRIHNYASTTAAKPFTITGGYYNNGKFVLMTAGLMRDTAAVTSLEIYGAGSSNSGTVLLYGVK